MNKQEFIEFVAKVAVADWKSRRIMLPSVVIAQACKESAFGTSELAVNANALFGIKKNGWTGKTYTKKADEQNADGTMRTDESCLWRAYDSWEQSILDHSEYIANRKVGNQAEPNFKAVVGETNVKKAIAALVGNQNRAATVERCTDAELRKYVAEGTTTYGYMTGLNYPQSLLDDYIIKYNLTQYDTLDQTEKESVTMAKLKVVIDAGHGLNTSGKRCMRSLDRNETREWYLNDRIADKLETMLKAYNCEVLRVDDTTGRQDISLANRVNKANAWGADVYISIHHNAGVNGRAAGGTVVYYYSSKAERATQAKDLYNAVVNETGLVGNRAQKVIKNGFYVIKNTKMPAFLLENGYMDSNVDVPIILSQEHADKTAQGLLNFIVKEFKLAKDSTKAPVQESPKVDAPAVNTNSGSYKVKVLVDDLNIRAGAGTKYAIKGVIKDHGIYTIVETSGNWGRLKSGAGWISVSSKYVKKV